MPEIVKLYKNLRDLDLSHMLYKTVEGLQIGAFNYRGRNVDLDEIETFFAIYDEPDKQKAQNAFEAWKNSLPDDGMEPFKKLVKTVHYHYEDIFAYWDAPFPVTNAYTEGLNGLNKMPNRLGRGYSYEIIRAKTLYSAEARKVGSGIRSGRGKVEYGPHIPTLVKQVESGELD